MSIKDGKWYQLVWLPFAAGSYIIICLFDFIIMPVYVASHNSRIESRVFAELDGKDVATFATTVSLTAQAARQWNPLTLMGGGMFHLAFGALLTGGAVTRGLGKKSEIEGYYKYGSAGYETTEGENLPYQPNRPGYNNGNRNPRAPEEVDGPMRRTTE